MKSEGLRRSQQHEARLAKRFSGSRNAASGAMWLRKGDVRSDDFLFEHKYTGKKSYTLKAEDLDKLFAEAILSSRVGVFGIHLDGKNYVILSEDDFHTLSQRAQEESIAPEGT